MLTILHPPPLTLQDQNTTEAVVLAELLLSTVRPARDVERRFCFEIVSTMDCYILQADNEAALSHWMTVTNHPRFF